MTLIPGLIGEPWSAFCELFGEKLIYGVSYSHLYVSEMVDFWYDVWHLPLVFALTLVWFNLQILRIYHNIPTSVCMNFGLI